MCAKTICSSPIPLLEVMSDILRLYFVLASESLYLVLVQVLYCQSQSTCTLARVLAQAGSIQKASTVGDVG